MIVSQEPLPLENGSSDLGRRVRNLLSRRNSLRCVTVEAADGTVTLRGTVRSYYDKQLCISGSRRVAGVYELVDQIQVKWPEETMESL